MRIIRLENNNDDIINKICEWNYNWWGIKNNNSLEENVYVDEKRRGNGICRKLMNIVKENAKSISLNELYLYTKHVGLYEKFGWKFIEKVNTFKDDSSMERLYKLDIE